MKEKRWGRIINMTDRRQAVHRRPFQTRMRSASSDSPNFELAPFNVTVNSVCPGAR